MDIHQLNSIELPTAMALAILATLGYVFGVLRQRYKAACTAASDVMLQLQRDMARAKAAAKELENVVQAVNLSTAKHGARLKEFHRRLARLGTGEGDIVWQDLCREVEDLLNPTLQLVNEIASAQERIRYQSNYLMAFSEVQIDPLTGLGNRRALNHMLNVQCELLNRYDAVFSLAVLDIDHFKKLNDRYGHQHGDQMLCDLAQLLREGLRAVDIPARYGGDELVVVMPQTTLNGATTLSERLRLDVEEKMPFTISVGVASARNGDTPESLFNRADAALYRAKSNGRNCLCSDDDESAPSDLPPSETRSVLSAS
jgi:diguanylate cyclase (GGDEF)-like protein